MNPLCAKLISFVGGLLLLCSICCGQAARDIFEGGETALARGDLRAAELAFQSVLRIEPNSVPALANLGVVYMRQRLWMRALQQFQMAEHLAPHNAGLELNIGLAQFRQGDYAAAQSAFQEALRTTPSSVQAQYLLALSYFAEQKYGEAAGNFEPLWAQENTSMPYLYVLALSANKAGQQKWEQQALQRMFEIGQNTAAYHLFLGRAWLLRQRDSEALKELRQAEQLDPKLPFVHFSLGTIYAAAGNYLGAKAEFEADAAREPDLADNQEQLAELSLKLDRPQEAEQQFRKSVKLNPRSARSYLGLAKIEKANGQYSEALSDVSMACQLDGESASAYYLRAQILTSLKRSAEAEVDFATSTRLRQSTRDQLQQEITGRPTLDVQIALPQ